MRNVVQAELVTVPERTSGSSPGSSATSPTITYPDGFSIQLSGVKVSDRGSSRPVIEYLPFGTPGLLSTGPKLKTADTASPPSSAMSRSKPVRP